MAKLPTIHVKQELPVSLSDFLYATTGAKNSVQNANFTLSKLTNMNSISDFNKATKDFGVAPISDTDTSQAMLKLAQ